MKPEVFIMKNKSMKINNNKGSVLVFALLIMVILSIIGVYTINDSVIEGKISRNHSIYKKNLYLAELGVKEAVQRMEGIAMGPVSQQPNGLLGVAGSWLVEKDFEKNMSKDDWSDKDGDGFPQESNILENARYLVEQLGYAPGNNIDLTDQGAATYLVFEYAVYGRGSFDLNSEFLLEVGYWKRY